jgi:opacity protein-like surface antigen
MVSKSFFSLLAVCLASFSLPALAQIPLNDVAEARGYGMANMLFAASRGTLALYANPASLSFDERVEIEGSGTLDFANNSYKFFGIGVADSKAGPVAAALSYHLVSTGPSEARTTAHLLTLAVAVPIAKMFHIGLSGRQHFVRGPQNSNPFNLNAGIGLTLLENVLSLSASAHNLINTSSIDIPRYFVLSGSGNILGLIATAEMRGNFNDNQSRFTWGGSLEYTFLEMLAVRGGYAYDQVQKASILGVGLGFSASGGSVDLGYRYTFGGMKNNVLALTGRIHI